MDLREFRDTLLRIDHPERVLSLADTYITMLEKTGDDFLLPKEHVIVRPALEYFAGDLQGWVKFIRGVRDRLPRNRRAFHPGVHALYRTVATRLQQQERRERLDAAVTMAVRKGMIEDSYVVKQAYANRCTQAWRLRRAHMLKVASKQSKTGRVSESERERLSKEFWAHVDAEIQNGELPKP